MNNLEAMKKERAEMAALKPEFKPQYGNKHRGGDQFRTQTLREIAEHSNVHEIEIHPNIVSELIERERLDRANAFIKSKLARLTVGELNELQVDINLVMFDEMIADGEAHVASQEVVVSDNKFEEPVTEVFIPEMAASIPEGVEQVETKVEEKSTHDGKKLPSKKGKK